jgi:hypothetical protein
MSVRRERHHRDPEYRRCERLYEAESAYRVDENMPLLAFDLLARIVAVRIDAAPAFSALFVLWLSMTAAVGLASRFVASRHFT